MVLKFFLKNLFIESSLDVVFVVTLPVEVCPHQVCWPLYIRSRCPLAAHRLPCKGAWVRLGRDARLEVGGTFPVAGYNPFHSFPHFFFIFKSLSLQDHSLLSHSRQHWRKDTIVHLFILYTYQCNGSSLKSTYTL